jgi:DNA-binding IclR family transcriptional regulator
VSAPVRSADGRVVAAISVVGPTFRLQGEVLARTRRAVLGSAARLTP